MIKTERFTETLKTNFLILAVRLFSVSGAVVWVTYPQLYFAHINKIQIIFIYNIIIYIYTLLFIIRFFLPNQSRRCELFCFSTFVFDQIVISYFTYNTGGFSSPFYSGYFVVTTISAFVLGVRWALLTALAGGIFYILFNYSYGIGLYNIAEIIYRIIPFFVIALPTGILSDLLEKHIKEIDSLNEKLKQQNIKLQESLEKIESMQKQLIKREKENALLEITEGLAHRLRNPIMSIGGMANILEKKLKKHAEYKELEKYVEYIKTESKNISQILNNILQMSDREVQLKFISLPKIIEKVLNEFDNQIKTYNIKVVKKFEERLQPIRSDEKKLKVALRNIIDNCIKAMKSGGILTIEVKKSTEIKNMVEINITDTAGGIPKEILKNIFKPFESGGEVKKGIGLPIAKHSVETVGGELYINSKIGQGTTFKILLPM